MFIDASVTPASASRPASRGLIGRRPPKMFNRIGISIYFHFIPSDLQVGAPHGFSVCLWLRQRNLAELNYWSDCLGRINRLPQLARRLSFIHPASVLLS
jgi:hypothetical protein